MRKFTKFTLTLALLFGVLGGVNAVKGETREVLVKSMFHNWDGVGSDANQTADVPGFESHLNESVDAGTTIWGDGNVSCRNYADLSGYTSIEFEGDAGVQVRVMLNRAEGNGDYTQIIQPIEANGKLKIDISSYDVCHLNAIKIPYNGSTGNVVTKIEIVKEVVVKLGEGFTELTLDMCKQWNNVNETASSTGSATYSKQMNLNKNLNYGDVVYGGNVPWSVYADLTAYKKLVIMGTPGMEVRVLSNRQRNETDGNWTDGVVTDDHKTFDANGCIEYSITGTYFHLNSIKAVGSGQVNQILLLDEGKSIVPIRIGAIGYTTFSSTQNVSAYKVKAFAAKYVAGSVQLTQVAAVPAGEGVILEATEASYALPVVASADAISSNNDLKVSDGSVVTADKEYYALYNGSHGVGFYLIDNGVTIPAGKAYLQIAASGRSFLGFSDEATAISNVKAETADDAIYNVAGQRVMKTQKGLYIVNGKKVLVK